MQFPEEFRGIITVLNTPFTEKDTLDIVGLERHVAYALDAGVAGFLTPAMAGEVAYLGDTERETVVSTVVRAVSGAVPVIGGASADTAEKRLHWVRRLTELGCDGVLACIPYTTDDEYTKSVRQLAALEPPFLMLQDWDHEGCGLPVSLIKRLFEEIPCFRCLKIEVANSGPKYTETLAATGHKLHVSGGWAVTEMIDGLDRGIHAFMPTGLHYTYTRIYNLYQQGHRDAAVALFKRLKLVLEYSNQDLPCSIHFFKQVLHAQGLYASPRIRQPLQSPVDAGRCKDRIALALLLEAEGHYISP